MLNIVGMFPAVLPALSILLPRAVSDEAVTTQLAGRDGETVTPTSLSQANIIRGNSASADNHVKLLKLLQSSSKNKESEQVSDPNFSRRKKEISSLKLIIV